MTPVFLTPSIQSSMRAMGLVEAAEALMATGEATLAPAAGVQMLTPGALGGVQLGGGGVVPTVKLLLPFTLAPVLSMP